MRRCQIRDVDVIANARAVRGIVVVAKDGDRRSVARGRQDERDQMGLGIVRFADFVFRIGAGGIEVAQRDRAQTVRLIQVGQNSFDDQFGKAVRIDRALRVLFR